MLLELDLQSVRLDPGACVPAADALSLSVCGSCRHMVAAAARRSLSLG